MANFVVFACLVVAAVGVPTRVPSHRHAILSPPDVLVSSDALEISALPTAVVDIIVALPDGTSVRNVDEPSELRYARYLCDYLGFSPSRMRTMSAHSLLEGKSPNIHLLPAGSIVILSHRGLASPRLQQGPSRRLLALLNATAPLVVVLTASGDCTLEWPSNGDTHHLLYRTSWNQRWHEEWRASRDAERTVGRTSGWLRELPYGMSYAPGKPTIDELGRGLARGVGERPLLFTFRGASRRKLADDEVHLEAADKLVAAFRDNRERIAAAVDYYVQWSDYQSAQRTNSSLEHSSGASSEASSEASTETSSEASSDASPDAKAESSRVNTSFVFETWDEDARTIPAERLPYARRLTESVLTLCPVNGPRDLYRPWEALHAGSIPVVVAPRGVSVGCDEEHLLHTTPGAIMIRDWSLLADALDEAMDDPNQLVERQRLLVMAFKSRRGIDRQELLQTVSDMQARQINASRWRPSTRCFASDDSLLTCVPVAAHGSSPRDDNDADDNDS